MKELQLKSPLPVLAALAHKLRPYLGVMLFLLLAIIYGYLILRINTLSNPTIDNSTVLTEAKSTPVPRIDAEAVTQLEALKDNSVNVQTLFDQGRDNPFDE